MAMGGKNPTRSQLWKIAYSKGGEDSEDEEVKSCIGRIVSILICYKYTYTECFLDIVCYFPGSCVM